MATRPGKLQSFWMAGFEGADHIDVHGNALDMSAATGHAQLLAGDYQRVAALGLSTVRESVGWRVCCPHTWRQRDFSRLQRAAQAAAAQGLQVVWTLMHYGTPPDLRLTDPNFGQRFADFAAAVAKLLRQHTGQPSVYNPINEIGFLAWAMSQQRILGGACDERDGYALKLQLVRAALLSISAIRAEDPGARFMHIEPLIHVVAPRAEPQLAPQALIFCGYQWQVWDMLVGRLAPELGGTPAAVDWVGVNHYHDAQWELGTGIGMGTNQALDWHRADPRRRPFASLLQQAWQRYRLPLVVAETSHVGQGRTRWLDSMARQVALALQTGVAVEGLCLYPAVDRPDWNHSGHWHRSGLWDALGPGQAESAAAQPLARRLAADYAAALQRWVTRLP